MRRLARRFPNHHHYPCRGKPEHVKDTGHKVPGDMQFVLGGVVAEVGVHCCGLTRMSPVLRPLGVFYSWGSTAVGYATIPGCGLPIGAMLSSTPSPLGIIIPSRRLTSKCTMGSLTKILVNLKCLLESISVKSSCIAASLFMSTASATTPCGSDSSVPFFKGHVDFSVP